MSKEKKLLLILFFNIALMLMEVAGGIVSRSLALLSDAAHMLTDSFALFLTYVALSWSKKPATKHKTFGYHRMEILAALINGLVLIAIGGYIFYEALARFFNPMEINVNIMLGISSIGLVGNIVGALLLHHESHENLNMRGAFLHLLGDTLSSVGVIIGGIIILLTGVNAVDSAIGVVISFIVLRGAFRLTKESADILLEGVPADVTISELKEAVERIAGVRECHDIHVWTITSGKRALSAHVLTDNISTVESQKILCKIRELLVADYDIRHTTLEVECEACGTGHCEFHE